MNAYHLSLITGHGFTQARILGGLKQGAPLEN